jgi:CheY-like chemotaxis protein
MKKVLIAQGIHLLLEQNYSFLNRTDIQLFVAATTDMAYKVHRAEHVDLIIIEHDMPGIPSEQLCSRIRKDPNLRSVSMIVVCENAPAAIEQSKQCGANTVLTRPVHPLVLMEKAQQLLDIATRGALRMALSATVDGRLGEKSFLCVIRNISASGMLIETDTSLDKDAVLSCGLSLPDGKKIQASCRVVRSVEPPTGQGRHYGVMFTDIAPKDKELLVAFVERTTR